MPRIRLRTVSCRSWLQSLLHAYCVPIACLLHANCMPTACLLRAVGIPTACLLRACCVPTACLLHTYCMPTACLPLAYCVPIARLLHAYCMPTACLLHAYCVPTAYLSHPCQLPRTPCAQHVSPTSAMANKATTKRRASQKPQARGTAYIKAQFGLRPLLYCVWLLRTHNESKSKHKSRLFNHMCEGTRTRCLRH